MSDFQDEFLFSAPSFHNFEEELQDEEHDDGYFDRLRKSTIQHRELASDAFDSVFEADGVALGEVSGDEQDAADDSLQVSQCEDDEEEAPSQMESIDSLFPEEDALGTEAVVPSSRRASVVAPPTAPNTVAAPEDEDEEDCNPAAVNAPSECYSDVLSSSAAKSGSASKAARKRKASETSDGKAAPKVTQLTIPNTPNLRVLKRTRSERIMSSTSLELQKIREEREAMKKQKAKFDKTYTHVKSVVAAPAAVPRSVKPLTQPLDVTFRVDARVRAEDEKPTEPFHSFAEKVLAFCSNMAHTIKSVVSIPAGPFVARATSPAPFKLATDELASRRGPHVLLSKEEEELKMMKEHKPFKARPVDPRVMNSAGVVGLSKVPRKPTTVAEPFVLESERLHKKAMEDKAKQMAEEAERLKREAAFKAAPVPAVAKVPEPARAAAPRAPTVPAPPALSTDDRAAAREKFEAEKASRAADAERAAAEAALRAKEREEAAVAELRRAASFKAAPFKKHGSPQIMRSTKAPTCPLTPHLQTDRRAATRSNNGLVL